MADRRSPIQAEIQGIESSMRAFNTFGHRVARSILRKAVRAGGAPMVKEAKKQAPKQTGNVKKSLAQKVSQYAKSATVASTIGSKRKARRRSAKLAGRKGGLTGGISGRGDEVPLHLLHGKTKAHIVEPWIVIHRSRNYGHGFSERLAWGPPGRNAIIRRYITHPGTSGNSFLRDAFRISDDTAVRKFVEKFKAETTKEVLKIARAQATVIMD